MSWPSLSYGPVCQIKKGAAGEELATVMWDGTECCTDPARMGVIPSNKIYRQDTTFSRNVS